MFEHRWVSFAAHNAQGAHPAASPARYDAMFDADRFLAAQADAWPAAIAELRAGAKRTHWMWFVFPQMGGLGRSATARHFAIADAAAARAYLAHPVLGARLVEAAHAVVAAPGSAARIMGEVDAIKLRSCATLFAAVADDPAPFTAILDRFFDGVPDAATRTLLERNAAPTVQRDEGDR